jgi:hypothetical protein
MNAGTNPRSHHNLQYGPKSIFTGSPKIVAGRVPDGPFWGRQQALPKFYGRAPTPMARKHRSQKKHKIKQIIKTRRFSLNLAQTCAGFTYISRK